MRLFIEGHNVKKGFAISRWWSDKECSTLPVATIDELQPVRFIRDVHKAKKLVARWNRRFATH